MGLETRLVFSTVQLPDSTLLNQQQQQQQQQQQKTQQISNIYEWCMKISAKIVYEICV